MARRKVRDIQRRQPKKDAYEVVLIVCEGEQTEVNYFNGLKVHEKLSSVNVEVIPGANSDPISVVQTAIEKANFQKSYLPYDAVYCVIDRDEHSRFDEALRLAQENNVKVIKSYPSFEYWYLCHSVYSRASFRRSGNESSGDACVKKVSECWKEKFQESYSKTHIHTYQKLLPFRQDAIKNSAMALKAAEQESERNPSTEVHQLVQYLLNLKHGTACR